MNVSLTPELEQFIANQVNSGHYRSSSEVVREALRNQIQQYELENFNRRIAQARQQVSEGKITKADDSFFESKRQRVKNSS